MKNALKKIKTYVSCVCFIPHWLFYKVSANKRLIDSDIVAWGKYRGFIDTCHLSKSLFLLLVSNPEFRIQFAWRLRALGHFLPWRGRGDGFSCFLGSSANTGRGFVLVHGLNTRINAGSHIGDNCTVLHNVTIGAGRGGAPTLGNNVYVGTGAIIIGGVTVGDNVNIGAGAIVVSDVPSNSTVVCEKARVIRRK